MSNLINSFWAGSIIPLENILSEWKTEDDVLDTVGGNDGTPTDITYTTLGVGKMAVFNGTTSKIVCTIDDPDIHLQTGSYSCLVKATSIGSSFRGIMGIAQWSNLVCSAGIIGTYSWGVPIGFKSTTISINDSTLHHLVLTFDTGVSNGTKIYIDGVLKLTTTVAEAGGTDMKIGDLAVPNQFANATIGDCRVWDVILTQDQVTELSTKELAGIDINP